MSLGFKMLLKKREKGKKTRKKM